MKMNGKITNLEVREFLKSFEKDSEIIILEEGSKEKRGACKRKNLC